MCYITHVLTRTELSGWLSGSWLIPAPNCCYYIGLLKSILVDLCFFWVKQKVAVTTWPKQGSLQNKTPVNNNFSCPCRFSVVKVIVVFKGRVESNWSSFLVAWRCFIFHPKVFLKGETYPRKKTSCFQRNALKDNNFIWPLRSPGVMVCPKVTSLAGNLPVGTLGPLELRNLHCLKPLMPGHLWPWSNHAKP